MTAGWLSAPTFKDPEQSRNARVIHAVILSTAIVSLVGMLVTPFVYPDREPYVLFGGIVGSCFIWLGLIRRGHVRVAALGFIGLIWLITFYAGFQYGGPRAPAMVALPVLVLMAGFVAGAPAAIGVALLSLVASFAVTQIMPSEAVVELTPFRYWIASAFTVLVTSIIVLIGLGALDGAIAEARESERRYAEMVEASPNGMVSVSSDGVIESLNGPAALIGGLPREEIEGRNIFDLGLIREEYIGHVIKNFPKVFTGEVTGPIEAEALRVDGSRVPIELRIHRVKRADGSYSAQATLRDLSERQAAAREVDELQARLLQSQKLESVGRLAGGVAHDFNNHLTAIRINSELLGAHLPEDSPGREMLAGIELGAERSGNLIRQLLAFSRKQLLRPRVIEVNELVSSLEPMLRRILPEDIALEVSLAGGLWHVQADPAQMETVLLNLVLNARDAMPTGGTLKLETANITRRNDLPTDPGREVAGEFVRILVQDSGVGIDAEAKARVFEPFFTTKGERGSGLGLSTVHGIVHQSGGSMTLESEPGEGSRFQIYLPRTEEPLTRESKLGGDELPDRSEGRILLVEDDEAVRALAVSVLRERGYEVWVAKDGLDALDLVKNESVTVDLLISDVIMPRLGGIGLVRALRDSQPELPVLFISGYSDRTGMATLDTEPEILQKPFTGRSLALKVHSILSPA